MRAVLCVLAGLLLAGCGGEKSSPPPSKAGPEAVPASTVQPDNRPVIAAFGDSLSAGFGAGPGHSYPDYLQAALDKAGYRYRVLNAGISGGTTSGGLSRAGVLAATKPVMVILELGGNDGLRGLPIESTEANLDRIIRVLRESGAKVVLAGMTLPPNYGPDYIHQFERVYKDLAARYRLPLIPFLLEGVATRRELMQADGIHPTAEGNRIVAQNVLRAIAPLLTR